MVDIKADTVTLKGRTDVAHIPYQPVWLLLIRGIQLVFAIVILGLSAYAGSGYLIFYAGYGIGIFSFVWTLLFIGYIEGSMFFIPSLYNKYIHLALECLSVIFWLSTFGALANVATGWNYVYSYSYYYIKRSVVSDYNSYANTTKAAAVFGAFEWALFVGSLISYAIFLHRHRQAELNVQRNYAANPGGVVGAQEVKMQPVVSQQAVPNYQQPVDPRYQQATMA